MIRRAESLGSSPLTRGKLPRGTAGRTRHGLIPAHAGKTSHTRFAHPMSPAHPRSRGENAYQACVGRAFAGSSPLTRGKPCPAERPIRGVGLIPAHAGKTRSSGSIRPRPQAHPRSRGENRVSRSWRSVIWGSSPLTRGKRPAQEWRVHGQRLIPAHAGKTGDVPSYCEVRRAHPRSRGENIPTPSRRSSGSGSSPLTRGKHSHRTWRVRR